jgi:hypothetical protein
MKVSELIEHLKTFNPDLEVWYCADLCDFSCYRLTPDKVRSYSVESYNPTDDSGKDIPCVMIGDLP